MSAVEIEVKFAVDDPQALAAKLLEAGFTEQTPSTFERNVLYDNAEHALRVSRTVLRIRQYGEHWLLTHKRLPADHDPSERHKRRIETETEVVDGEALATIFSSLGYFPTFIYEKWRTEYADGTGHCVVDRTPIGIFAELEGPEAWIDGVAARLGLPPETLSTLSYGRLFERWREQTGREAEHLTFADCAPAS